MTRHEIINELHNGPSYALDIAIAQALVPQILVMRQRNDDSGADPHTYRNFTTSIDDAVWLAGVLLPGWVWRVATCCVSDDAWVFPDFNCPVHGERLKRDFGQMDIDPSEYWLNLTDIDLRPSGRPAIAMCISILTALEAIDEMRASNNVERGSAFSPRPDASNGEV